ncbi:head-tail connector protein [Glaciimonas sp. GNP009]
MAQRLITPPTELAVTLDQAKANLRVDGSDMDALITMWTQGIIASLEHEIGQCLMSQVWEVTLDAFPIAISLPHPVIGVSSVNYVDTGGLAQTLSADDYKLVRSAYASSLVPASGTLWPGTFQDANVVTVTLICGCGATPDDTPANVRLYILAKLVEQFDPATRLERDTVQSDFVGRLLDACRTYT